MESWQDFWSKIETVHESARLHKLLGKTHANEPGMLRLPGYHMAGGLKAQRRLMNT